MKMIRPLLAATIAASTMSLGPVATPASAQLLPLMLLDKGFKEEAKKAKNTPGHVEWCRKKKPGFRAEWNNWRTSDGRVEYCASPYYTPPWRKNAAN